MVLLSTIGDASVQDDELVACAHRRLVGRWRSPELMGDDARAMGFICQDCGREFLPYRVRNRHVISD